MKPWFKDLLLALTMSVALVTSAPGASQVRAQTEQVRGHEPQVTITGVANETVAGQPPAVGHVLRAEATAVDPDQDTIDTIEYRWLRGGTEVGTAQTYTATAADVGQTLTIEVTATTDAATTDPASGQARTTVTVGANTAPTANPTISGTPAVGAVLTGSVGYADAEGDAEGTHSYQWYRADDAAGANRTPISGATAATYTVVSADQGKYLVFEVTPKSATGTPDTGAPARAVVASVVNGTAPTASPTITGSSNVGATLTGSVGYADAEGDAEGTHSYQWYRADDAAGANRTPISGATAATYTVVSADQGKYLVFEVIPKSATGTPNTGVAARKVSASAVTGTAPTVKVGSVSITGTYMVGETLTGVYAYEDADGDLEDAAGLSVMWQISHPVSGLPTTIPGATGMTYVLRPEDAGNRKIWFSVERVKSQTGTPNERLRPQSPEGQWQASRSGTIVAAISATANQIAKVLPRDTVMAAFNPLTASGGKAPYTYEIVSGTLPAGLSFNAGTGAVTGTPTTQQVASDVVFRVKDANGTVAATTSTVSFTVTGTAPTGLNLRVVGDAIVGTTLTAEYDYSDADGDLEGDTVITWCQQHRGCGATGRTYTLQSSDIGEKVQFRLQTKSLTGTPNLGEIQWSPIAGNDSAVIAAITATANQTAQVLPRGTAMTAFNPLTASGGKAPYTYEIVSGTLPAGLSFNAGTGAVTGTPTTQQAAANVVFRVKDANGTVAATTSTVSFTVTGSAPDAVDLQIVGDAIVGQTLTAQYRYVDADGDAEDPATAADLVWCRPNAPGCVQGGGLGSGRTYVVQASDVGQKLEFQIWAKSMTGTPNQGPGRYSPSVTVLAAITATANQTAQVLARDTAMTAFNPLTASGGKAPYTYEIVSGTLPAGLSLNASTGAVTGTPTTTQAAANVVFRVKDANGVVAATTSTVSFMVSVIDPLIATANQSGQALTVAQANYSFTPLTASGGTAPYTYEIASGTLPVGLALNASTGKVTGVPTVDQAASNVIFRVRDATGAYATTTSTVSFAVNRPQIRLPNGYAPLPINTSGSVTFAADPSVKASLQSRLRFQFWSEYGGCCALAGTFGWRLYSPTGTVVGQGTENFPGTVPNVAIDRTLNLGGYPVAGTWRLEVYKISGQILGGYSGSNIIISSVYLDL